MVISGDRQHSASRREDAGEQAAKVSWVGWVGKGIQFVGVRGQLWKGCGSEVGFEEKSFLRVKEAEATSSGEHLHRYEGSQHCLIGSTQSTYRSAGDLAFHRIPNCGLAGERRCAEKARATVEETTLLCMLEQLCARAFPKVPEREIERRRKKKGCRKAPGTGSLPAPPHTCVGEDRIGI